MSSSTRTRRIAAAILPSVWLLSMAAPPAVAAPAESFGPVGSPSAGLVKRPFGSVDGAPLGYLEYLPPGYGDGELRPLLVFTHGGGEGGDGSDGSLDLVASLGIPPLIEAGHWPADRPFVVLSPQLPEATTNDDCGMGDDLAAFLDFAVRHYEVDATRVYLTGIS
jgi:poly(3-hydroxybutyrate) depolymerase